MLLAVPQHFATEQVPYVASIIMRSVAYHHPTNHWMILTYNLPLKENDHRYRYRAREARGRASYEAASQHAIHTNARPQRQKLRHLGIVASWHRGCVQPVLEHKIRNAAKVRLGPVSQESCHSINEQSTSGKPVAFDH
jgi:hypothetical protein